MTALQAPSPGGARRSTRLALVGIVVATLLSLGVTIAALAIGGRPDPPALRAASTTLDGEWRFRLGDDVRWAAPELDDSGWETIDLSAVPGSHDADVGLPDYVPGWAARGHRGYQGYAWYRRTVAVPAGPDGWGLLGPTAVDDGYELYWNGERLGGSGRLGAAPRVVGTRPMRFALPAGAPGTRGTLALRVYMQPGVDFGDESGGVHTAPLLVPRSASDGLYRAQWWRTIAGYIVDVVEPIAMLALAGVTLAYRTRSLRKGFLAYASVALALTAAKRVGNPIYYWTDLQSLTTNLWWTAVVWAPLGRAAWALTWNHWGPRPWRTLDVAAAAFAVAEMAGGAWHSTALTRGSRLGASALFASIAVRVLRRGPRRALAFATMAAIAIGQFADELSALGVPGIWFPLGIGVSRTQYAYAVAVPLLAFLIVSPPPSDTSGGRRRAPAGMPRAEVRGTR